MARSKPKSTVSESRLFVLALGLLVGFAMAFVLLLSRLPVDGIISQHANGSLRESEMTSMDFDYYSVLPEQHAARKPAPPATAVEPPVIFMEPPSRIEPPAIRAEPALPVVPMPQIVKLPPGTQRVQPAPSVQQADARPQAPVGEMLASVSGQDSYYVEAGNYRQNADALQIQSLLRSRGLDAFIVVREENGGGFGHRVRIGPFFEQSRLDATRERLRASGIRPKLIRVKG
ncbi:MAG: SPOR domain-containing protein [Granulosicoccus sp.]